MKDHADNPKLHLGAAGAKISSNVSRSSLQRDGVIKSIFSAVAPYIDFLSTFLSFGLSGYWRERAVEVSGIQEGDRVLDLCTGTGELAFILSKRVGVRGEVVGADFCREMLDIARRKALREANGNLNFVFADARDIDYPDSSFDAVTMAFGMRNIPDTARVLKEIKRLVRPGGTFVCLELTRPGAEWFRRIYQLYLFRVVPLVGRLVTGSKTPYSYLPQSIFSFHSSSDFGRLIEEQGFRLERTNHLTMGVATVFRAVRDG